MLLIPPLPHVKPWSSSIVTAEGSVLLGIRHRKTLARREPYGERGLRHPEKHRFFMKRCFSHHTSASDQSSRVRYPIASVFESGRFSARSRIPFPKDPPRRVPTGFRMLSRWQARGPEPSCRRVRRAFRRYPRLFRHSSLSFRRPRRIPRSSRQVRKTELPEFLRYPA